MTGIAYFVLGIPLSYFLAFVKDQQVRGLWWGPTLAVAFNTIMYNIIIWRLDWVQVIRKAIERE